MGTADRPPPKKRGFWRLCRLCFRGFRIVVWLLILALLCALIYVNQVGLPDIVKRPLLQKLAARGLDLRFSRLRLRWYEGVVAEDVRFGSARDAIGPELTAREVRVQLDWRALARRQLQVEGLLLRHGRFAWPVLATHEAPRQLAVENIQTELRFLPDDQWALDRFAADFAGAKILLGGTITNASALREWASSETEKSKGTAGVERHLRKLADTLEQIHFSAPPELKVEVHGDARDLQSFRAVVRVNAPGAQTPWGAVSQGRFTARLFAADSNGISRAELRLQAGDAQTRWGAITNFNLELLANTLDARTNVLSADLKLAARAVRTEWAEGNDFRLAARWTHSLTNPIPLKANGEVQCAEAASRWGRGRGVFLQASLASNTNGGPAAPDPAWAWWTNLQPYLIQWHAKLADFQSPKLQAGALAGGGSWSQPRMVLTNFEAALYQGRLAASGELDVASRAAKVRLTSDFDPQRIAAVLTDDARCWLDQFTWEQPPRLKGEVSAVLPSWTNRQPDWRGEVLPTLNLQAEFQIDRPGSYRKLPVSAARSHVSYSNLCWYLPDLEVLRPEGRLRAVHRANDRTKEFYWRIHSTADLRAAHPLLAPAERQVFDLLTLRQPPAIDAEIWGRFHQPELTGIRGTVALTNFAFRGETANSLQVGIAYTDSVLQCFAPVIERGTQHMRADGLTADFKAQLVYLTNGFSTTDPMVIARAIGPHIARAIEAYQFERPPTGRVFGVIPMHGEAGADLHFLLDGGPFHWWKFNLPHIVGHVHWQGEQLSLKDVNADFYGGAARGSAEFRFTPREATDFNFLVTVTNTLLQALMADLSPHTNHPEGTLNGNLVVTKANTESTASVNGYGSLAVRDGLLWDIPLFGVFSPVLNGIVPGLGNSRASAAACDFVITNGVVRTDDLDIRCQGMRLQYRGTVDLEGNVKARVEAGLLKDMFLVGPLVSTVFWPVTKMFEYKVTGTLADPRTEPLFLIPKLVLLPFHPFRTLKSFLPEDSSPTRTNAPPATNAPAEKR